VYFSKKNAKIAQNAHFIDKSAKLSTTYELCAVITFARKMVDFRKNCTFAAFSKGKNRQIFVIFRKVINSFFAKSVENGKIQARF
jgi:hypothetical protein